MRKYLRSLYYRVRRFPSHWILYGFFGAVARCFENSISSDDITLQTAFKQFLPGRYFIRSSFAINFLREISKGKKMPCYFSFRWGGGAALYLDRILQSQEWDECALCVKPANDRKLITIELWKGGKCIYEGLLASLLELTMPPWKGKISRLIINELVTWEHYIGVRQMTTQAYQRLIAEIILLRSRLGVDLIYLVHDYYSLCPRIQMVAHTGRFCGCDCDIRLCNQCLRVLGVTGPLIAQGIDIAQWREASRKLLSVAMEVRTFSEDTRQRLIRAFGLKNASCFPHQPLIQFTPLKISSVKEPVIGIVGNIYYTKGADIVLQLSQYLLTKNEPTKIVIIGELLSGRSCIIPSNIKVTGAYKHAELPEKIKQCGVNIVFFPSIWPETFSYVTQEVMMLGLPIVCFNLGAPVERITNYAKGAIIPSFSIPRTYDVIKMLFKRCYSVEKE